MKRLFMLVLVTSHSFILSVLGRPGHLDKRQLELFDAFAKGNMTSFMKTRRSMAELEKFAQALGASYSEAGELYDFLRNIANGEYGQISRSAADAPEFEELPARTKVPNSKTVKTRIGPFIVPNANVSSIVGEMGMLYNYPMKVVPRPCEGNCTILGMTAGVEYANGSNAGLETGLWLHHTILLNIGEGRFDASRKDREISIPHNLVGSTPRKSERIFASGNERTPVQFPDDKRTKIGYKVNENDKFAMVINLMNITPKDKVAYLTMTYDVISGHPEGWENIKPVWLELDECDNTDLIPEKLPGKFSVACNWTANLEGEVVGAAGHLHDDGTRLTLDADGKQACNSIATHASSSASLNSSAGARPKSGHGTSGKHIGSMSICRDRTLFVKRMVKGQRWKLTAFYDIGTGTAVPHVAGEGDFPGVSLIYLKED